MTYSHSNVYIVRVTDTLSDGETNEWFAGPYGSTRADQTADHLEAVSRDDEGFTDRRCVVEALFSDDECLRVDDYVRREQGSLT
ncbi:hypothetical protein [Calidifontibacter terrae]